MKRQNYCLNDSRITIRYGLFNFPYYFLYDPLCTFSVTINNQLWILMLIERLHLAGYKCISANTDGLLLHIKKDDLDNVRLLYKEWEIESGFTLEETYFSVYVRRDINNYACLTSDGKKKVKGSFVPQGGILKGFVFPVIAKALQAYYFDGIHPSEFITNHRDIYDFCISQKVGNQFTNYSYLIEDGLVTERTELQKTLRFFVSNPTGRDIILKKVTIGTKREKRLVSERIVIPAVYETERRVNPASGRMKNFTTKVSDRVVIPAQYEIVEYQGEKEVVYASGNVVTLFNDYYDVANFVDYNINYDYYINRTLKEISKIGAINDMDVIINIVEEDGTVVSTVTGDAAEDLDSLIDDEDNVIIVEE